MKPFSLLIKPASADCNLRCSYCFYLPKSALYPSSKRHRMTDAVLDRLVSSFMATEQEQYAFGWQGGEPLLMGLDFWKRVTALQEERGRSGAVVANGLQTNATLLDDATAAHFAKYRFLLGVSLDGPSDVHDAYRRTAAARGSHSRVLRGIETLRRHGAEFNILTLVSKANARRGREVYSYLADSGFLFHQYIPCVEFDSAGALAPYAITGDEWGDFLVEVFDAWRSGDERRVSVRLFDSILSYLVDGVRNCCTMQPDCRQYFLVEHNGDVYPCDFFAEPALRLGNVLAVSWNEMLSSECYAAFGARKSDMTDVCRDCEYLELVRRRLPEAPRHLHPPQRPLLRLAALLLPRAPPPALPRLRGQAGTPLCAPTLTTASM